MKWVWNLRPHTPTVVGDALKKVMCPGEPAGEEECQDQLEFDLGHRGGERVWARPDPAGLSSGVHPEGMG